MSTKVASVFTVGYSVVRTLSNRTGASMTVLHTLTEGEKGCIKRRLNELFREYYDLQASDMYDKTIKNYIEDQDEDIIPCIEDYPEQVVVGGNKIEFVFKYPVVIINTIKLLTFVIGKANVSIHLALKYDQNSTSTVIISRDFELMYR